MIRELAGIHAPGAGARPEDLRRALGNGAATVAGGALAVQFTGGPATGAAGPLCLLDGELHDGGRAAPVHERAVAAAWSAHGSEIVGSLRGCFSLLLWDPDRQRGLLARDHFGNRPLFLHEAGGVLRFASEVRILLAMLPSRPAPDDVAVVNWLARGAAGRGRTLYEGIRPLLPGRLIELGDRRRIQRRYWDLGRLPVWRPSRDEAAHELRNAIERAISSRTAAAGAVAAELSGGIDSATVTALAARLEAAGGPPLRAYSAVFPDHPTADEAGLVDAVSGALGLTSVTMAVEGGAAVAPALRFIERWQVPLGPANHFLWDRLLRRAAADGMDVTLNGQGGDELFGAPVYLLADRLAHGRLGAAYRLTGRIPGLGDPPPAALRRRAFRLWGLRGALPHRVHRAAWRRRAASRHVPALLAPQAGRLLADTHDPYPWKERDGPRWRAERLHLLTDGADGMGVADYLRRRAADAGIHSAQPFLDVELAELMLSLPPELSFDPHLSRPLLREASRGLVPDRVRLRSQKSTFDAVLTDTLLGPDLIVVRRLLCDRSAEVNAWADASRVRKMAEGPPQRHPGGTHAWSKALWRVAGLELWLREQADPGIAARMLAGPGLAEPRYSFRAAKAVFG